MKGSSEKQRTDLRICTHFDTTHSHHEDSLKFGESCRRITRLSINCSAHSTYEFRKELLKFWHGIGFFLIASGNDKSGMDRDKMEKQPGRTAAKAFWPSTEQGRLVFERGHRPAIALRGGTTGFSIRIASVNRMSFCGMQYGRAHRSRVQSKSSRTVSPE